MLTGRMDHKGRVVVPADVRTALHLTPGDVVFFTVQAIGTWARTPAVILVRATPPEVTGRPTNR